MPIETFKPAPQQLAAALKGPIYDSPAPVQQGMTPTTAGAPDAMMQNSPFASSFSQGLIDQSMRNQNRSPWELAGNLAMLTSGYYHKSKDDAQLLKRDQATRVYLEQHLPDYVPLWDSADAEQRKEISKQARATILNRAEETRRRAQSKADLKGVNDVLSNGGSMTDARRALMASDDPALATLGVKSGLDDLHEEAKSKRADAKAGAERKAAYDLKYNQAIQAGMTEQQARAHAAGIDMNVVGAGATDDPYATNYDVASTKGDRQKALDASSKLHVENTKKLREQVTGAVRQQRVLQTVEGIIRDPNVYQGVGSDQVTFLKKLGSGLGLDVKGSDKEQLLQSIANDLAKGAREGYPGAVSNFEYQRYLASIISGKNTREGNEAILKYMREASILQFSAQEDMKEWQRLRASQGKPAYLDESFDRFHQDRQQERVAKLAELEQQAKAARDQAESVTREQRLQSKRGANTPGASTPSPASATARPRASNGQQTIEWDGTQWVPVQ